MKDFEKDLIYYPNPDPVKEPRFILKSVDELEKSTKYSVTCNGTERVVYHTDSFDYVVVVDNEAYDLEISIHTPYEKLEIRPSSFGIGIMGIADMFLIGFVFSHGKSLFLRLWERAAALFAVAP